MPIELRQLRYLLAVADEGHITRAAERLGMAQPPLTRQIAQLEAKVGARLFERHAKGVTPTEAGRALAQEARAILARTETLADVAGRAARGETGRVAIGYTSSAVFQPFAFEQIRAFGRAWPGVSLALVEDGTPDLVAALRHERLDAAFLRSAAEAGPDLVLEPLLDEAMLLATPSDHRLAGQGAIALRDLAGETLVLYRRQAGPGLHEAVVAACRAAGFNPVIGQEAPRMTSTLGLVSAGLGISIVPASMRRMNIEGVSWAQIHSDPPLTAPLLLATRRRGRSQLIERFRQAVLAARPAV